jgi:hypothetical protein
MPQPILYGKAETWKPERSKKETIAKEIFEINNPQAVLECFL